MDGDAAVEVWCVGVSSVRVFVGIAVGRGDCGGQCGVPCRGHVYCSRVLVSVLLSACVLCYCARG